MLGPVIEKEVRRRKCFWINLKAQSSGFAVGSDTECDKKGKLKMSPGLFTK